MATKALLKDSTCHYNHVSTRIAYKGATSKKLWGFEVQDTKV
jgi:hypothetical protein